MTVAEQEAVRAAILNTASAVSSFRGVNIAKVALHTSNLLNFLTDNGYYALRVLSNGKIIGLQDYMFTTGIVVGLCETGYERRYCYPEVHEAEAAHKVWDGQGHPIGPWVKMKGLWEGSYVDLLNPNFKV